MRVKKETLTHMSMRRQFVDNIEDLLLYIENHKNELEEELQNQDGHDSMVPYLEGAIEAYEHILGKAQSFVKH